MGRGRVGVYPGAICGGSAARSARFGAEADVPGDQRSASTNRGEGAGNGGCVALGLDRHQIALVAASEWRWGLTGCEGVDERALPAEAEREAGDGRAGLGAIGEQAMDQEHPLAGRHDPDLPRIEPVFRDETLDLGRVLQGGEPQAVARRIGRGLGVHGRWRGGRLGVGWGLGEWDRGQGSGVIHSDLLGLQGSETRAQSQDGQVQFGQPARELEQCPNLIGGQSAEQG